MKFKGDFSSTLDPNICARIIKKVSRKASPDSLVDKLLSNLLHIIQCADKRHLVVDNQKWRQNRRTTHRLINLINGKRVVVVQRDYLYGIPGKFKLCFNA